MLLILYFLAAAGCGGMGAMLGLGGGVFLVPLLTLAFHLPIKVAVGASLISVIAASTAAGTVYAGSGFTHLRLAVLLEITTTLGAVLGGFTTVWVSGRWLEGLFGLVMLTVAYIFLRRNGHDDTPPPPTGALTADYVDPALGTRVHYGVRRIPQGMLASFLAGNVSGMLGIGGGAVKVPMMHLMMGVPMKPAIATSTFMIGITGAASALIYYQAGLIRPDVAGPTALGVLLGARIGAHIGRRLHSTRLRQLLVVVVIFLALQMLSRALQ